MAEQSLSTDAAQHAFQRLDLFKAALADGKPGNINEWRIAEAAVGREQDREQALSRVLKNLFQPA